MLINNETMINELNNKFIFIEKYMKLNLAETNILIYFFMYIILIKFIKKENINIFTDISKCITFQNICKTIILCLFLNKNFLFNTDTFNIEHNLESTDIIKLNDFVKNNIEKVKSILNNTRK